MRLLTLLLYQAFERPEQFVGYVGSITIDVETGNHIHGSEVRAVRAFVPAGDGDVLSPKDLRVALVRGRGQGLDECEVFVVTEFLTDLVAS